MSLSQHNLPEEYLDEVPELRELLRTVLNTPEHYVEFYRVYEHRDPERWIAGVEIVINSLHAMSREYNHIRWFRQSFIRWNARILGGRKNNSNFEGFGDTPLAALQDSIFRFGLEKAYECTR